MAFPCNSWLYNEGFKHLFLFFWLAINTLLFWRTFSRYYSGQQYYYLHQMLGLGLCISRASASVLNFNCCLVLLPMCRTLLAVVRTSKRIVSRKTRRLLYKYKSFHAACGIAICIFSAVHVGAHIINADNFSTNYNTEYIALNVARYKNEDPRKMIFTSVPGVTGILMVLILFLMSTASTASIRASNFDIFLHTHNLFFIFYVLLLVHASGGVLKYQTNLEEHPPGCLQLNKTMKYYAPLTEPNGEAFLPNMEKLAPSPSQAHGELLINDSTLSICTKDPAFEPHFPEYIVLQCPRVSALENHPFTLTMCPTETRATFAVHIKVVGDWTGIYIDGPFGSPSEEALNYEVSLCIAGGIGVTPYASIFNQLLDKWREYKVQRLYFVWICRDIQAFLWFADLLCILHKKLWQENRPDYLNIRLYLSQTDGIQKIIGEEYQALNSRLIIGRPRWKLLFDEIAKSNRQKSVGVFCCGPKGLSKDLHKLCNRPNTYGTRFEYNKESFS
ncbi:hypothetical protein GDO81_024525 [Engystomops pustulosus]|uniref:PLAT domain-containing protein n=1 Tax=Engystomops pustulosus TaxID=76066 RepID=A0AAV6ZQ03_ENGPU|nr:hypothetical protein GDO81_024525 [Engystomops pustulosus]